MAVTPESQRCSTSAMRTKAIEAAMFAADWLGCTLAEAPAAVAVQVHQQRTVALRWVPRARPTCPAPNTTCSRFCAHVVWASRMP
jgi:hypothetical protein